MGVVLAGGASSRFGAPKGLAEVGGVPMIERVLRVQGHVFAKSIVVGAPEHYADLPVPVIRDVRPGLGPVGGLLTALSFAKAAGTSGVCCSPCDAPFVEPALYRALLAHAAGAEAVVPRQPGGVLAQPLFGWYATEILPTVERLLTRGIGVSMHHLLDELQRVTYLSVSSIPLRHAADLVFMNVNSPDELVTARARLPEFLANEG